RDWSSDVCSSDLVHGSGGTRAREGGVAPRWGLASVAGPGSLTVRVSRVHLTTSRTSHTMESRRAKSGPADHRFVSPNGDSTMAKTTQTTTAAIIVPAFPGRELLAAQAEHDKAAERVHVKYHDKVKALFNSWLDAARAAGVPRDEAGCKSLRKAFTEHEVIARGVVEGV